MLSPFIDSDVVDRWSGKVPALIVEVAFGLACAGAAVLVRMAIDLVAPTAGPFSLIYPATMIATLFGRWRAGLITLVTAFLWAWYFVLPPAGSFHFANSSDGPRTLVNGCAALVILWLAEKFRSSVRRMARERDEEIAKRGLLLRELDHRTKNNFMIVASLLELQMRRQSSPVAREALAAAVSRVHSFAAAHQSLYDDGDVNELAMGEYLRSLTGDLVAALFLAERVELKLAVDEARMPRDQAVAIGLVLNEVVTNAAKHAFGPDDAGTISVEFRAGPRGWRLTVCDDGRGVRPKSNRSGLGSSLIEAFGAKAGGTIVTERLERGTRVTLSGFVAAHRTGLHASEPRHGPMADRDRSAGDPDGARPRDRRDAAGH